MRTFIIAEIGSNHDGSLERAKRLVDIARGAGADAAKFQLIPPFREEWLEPLIEHCGEMEFMATPFNQNGIDALLGNVKHWKIASTEAADPEFVEAVFRAADGDPVFVSDGSVDSLPAYPNLIRMACVVEYPASAGDYSFPIGTWGLSDHTEGTFLAPVAVAAGAIAVEKHITDDPSRSGPDHHYALTPEELREMVQKIRLVERILKNEKRTIRTHVGRKLEW